MTLTILGATSWVTDGPGDSYIGLLDNNGELSGNGYARVQIRNGSTGWTFAGSVSGGVLNLSNATQIDFPQATGAWVAPTKVGLWSHASNTGSEWKIGEWDFPTGVTPEALSTGGQHRFPAGEIDINITVNNFTADGVIDFIRNRWGTSYIGLSAGVGGATELSGNGYVRQLISWDFGDSPMFDANGKARYFNFSKISFPTPTGNWTTPTHYSIHSAQTGGNLYFRKALSQAIAQPTPTRAVFFDPGTIEILLTP